MPGEATILHADADSFFASVEQRDDPRLRGRPVIVGGGVVLAASYEAKAFGVRTAMGGRAALRLCPRAVVVPPRMAAYTEASKALYAVFEDTTPLVEGLSIDEAFLDVRGMERIAGTPVEIAARLRVAVRERVGLPVTVGIARTKFLAKVASAVGKPDGLLLVAPDGEPAFLHPLPIERIWGVGPVTARKLRDRGIATVGELACVPAPALEAMLGRSTGGHLHALANLRDPRHVQERPRRRSIGSQHARSRSWASPHEIDADLVALVERVMRRVRAAHRVGRTVVLRFRFDDFSRATRSHTLAHPTARTQTVLDTCRSLLAEAGPTIAARGLTLIGVSLTNLGDDLPFQLRLPIDRDGDAMLDEAIDEIRDRFGTSAVTRALLLGRPPDLEMPLLSD
ncbi:MAG TPA: DNA polymerase IV [Gaiellaceae bacterium]|nr:DNA polymerase IV [Gaiellaceae bacterium]